MRRLIREGDPPSGQLASPVPQYWNPSTEAFEDVLGAHGAPRSILYGPNGEPIGSSNPLPVADSALAQAVAQLATEGKLEEARALLETISQKDFATQTTLSEVLQRLVAIEEQLETGDAKVQLTGQNVLLREGTVTVTAGSRTSLPGGQIDVSGFGWVYIDSLAQNSYAHKYKILYEIAGRYMLECPLWAPSSYDSVSTLRMTEYFRPHSNRINIRVENNSDSDATYLVRVFGSV